MKRVVPVDSKRQLTAFIDFPHHLYARDKHYVPELFIAQRDMLTPGKHPFYEHAKVRLFLAYEGDSITGRIAAIVNGNHNSFNQAEDGFFGFFDCEEQPEIAQALFDTAAQWLREQGAKTIIGPVNFSTNETCGLLVEGFDSPPVVMMPYNYAYYGQLLEQAGFYKKADLLAYQIQAGKFNEKASKLADALSNRLAQKDITIRPIDMKRFKQEAASLREIYNHAWDKNLGFVPMTPQEFDHMAKDLKLILDPDFCMIAEHKGQAIGFSLCLPDINQVLIKIKKGRLLPTGLLKLLWLRKTINGLRVITLGVLEPYRKLGIEACFYAAIIQKGYKKQMKVAEASWVLENNKMMNQALLNMGAQAYKRYRIYEKLL